MEHAPAGLAEASVPAVPALKALLTAPTGHGTGVGQPTDVTPLSAWELWQRLSERRTTGRASCGCRWATAAQRQVVRWLGKEVIALLPPYPTRYSMSTTVLIIE
jgi:hypothetical protein